jgi:hypothetical protein
MSLSSPSGTSIDDKAFLDESSSQNVDHTTASIPLEGLDGETDSPSKLTPRGSHEADKLVAFHPGDKDDPKNWSNFAKWNATLTVSMICFVVAFSSSVITSDIIGVVEEFHVSEEVALLSVTLFVVGFGLGTSPLVLRPSFTAMYCDFIFIKTSLY